MTITLAAVYAPVGIQGGLTGALFREFAFTLAGAVIVSGVVALTLSPMMGSRLLRAGRHRARLRRAGSTARFDALRARLHARCSPGRCAYRPVVLALWAIVVAADRAVLPVLAEGAGARPRTRASSSASSRPPPTRRSTRRSSSPTKVNDVYQSFPETEQHLPDHLSRPAASAAWSRSPGASARRRTAAAPDGVVGASSSKIPGIRVIPLTPPPLPGGGDFPVDFVIASTAEPQQLVEIAEHSSSARRSRAGSSSSPTPT